MARLEKMEAVLGHKLATKPPVAMESSVEEQPGDEKDPCIEDTESNVSESQVRCTSRIVKLVSHLVAVLKLHLQKKRHQIEEKVHNSSDKVEVFVEMMRRVIDTT